MLSYRNLLKQAWNITWKHKFLWFFGLFSTLLAAGGSIEYKILNQNINQGLVNGSLLGAGSFAQAIYMIKNFCLGFINLFTYDFLTILNTITILLICAALMVTLIWLAVSSQAALVISVKKILINNKKKENLLTVRDGLTAGHKKFWPVLGLNILIKIAVNAIIFITSLPLIFLVLKDSSLFMFTYVLLFVIFLPVAISLSLVLKYAIAYSVLENENFIKSIEEGWKLFIKNWLVSLEMAVILFIINFFASLAILLAVTILFLPLFIVGLNFGFYWLIVLMVFLALIFVVLSGSALGTFQISTWTNLFIKLREGGFVAKLERIFSRK
ncbi:MAG: hypothetical protein ACYC40_00115 [Patescibacteria group bacterium]